MQLLRVFAKAVFWFTSKQVNEFHAWFPLQQVHACAAKDGDVDPVVVGVPMVKHHDCLASGAQHAMDFTHRRCCVGCVMEYAVRVDQVK